MGKTALFVGLLTVALCSGALAQSQPLVSPTATPVPPETLKNQTFMLYDVGNKSKLCLRVTVALLVNITYINTQKENVSYMSPLTNGASIDENNSTCNISATTASLYIVPDDNDDVPFTILFKFTGDSATGKNHWAWGNMTFILEEAESLEDYDKTIGMVEFMTKSRVHGDSNAQIEFERSYKCVADQMLNFTAKEDIDIHPYVYVSQLQAQAFHFSNSSKYDDARVCLLDSAGKANKIVPIAVGAALAGLVVVLIAYLIGRLRSRRQSSYEALS